MENERSTFPHRLRTDETVRGKDFNDLVDALRGYQSVSTVSPEEIPDLLYGSNITVNNITVLGSIISTFLQGIKFARVTVTSFGAGYTRTGNVITASANGTLGAQDGVTLVTTDRILLRSGNSDAGLYEVTSVGSAGTPFVLTRTTDADESTEMVSGTLVYVRAGTVYADTLWRLVTEPPIVLNTDSLDFRLLAPQGVRLLAQEIYGRSSIRFISGSGATVTVADDAANDEVEVTIAAAASITVDTVGDHFQETDAANPAYSGIVTIIADKDSGLDWSVSGTTGTLKMLDANTSFVGGDVFYPGKVTTGAQAWKGDKKICTNDTDKGNGETWINGGFISLRASGPVSTAESGLAICCGSGTTPVANTSPDLDLGSTSQRTFWADDRGTGFGGVAGMSLWSNVAGSARATSVFVQTGGHIIFEGYGYNLFAPQIWLRWGSPGAWNLVYGATGSDSLGNGFTSGLLTTLGTGSGFSGTL